jgi:hypothetical protein
MARNIPKIREFPADERYWRVDAFGAIIRNHNIPSEPFIQIVISPFIDNDLSSEKPKELASSNAVNDDDRKSIQIGVGQLPFISIGSVWKNGFVQSFKTGTESVLYGVNIIDENITIINANHKIDDKYLVPPNFYKFGKEGLYSKLIAISSKGDPFGILIPAIEIIRFYYALSTHLSHAVFSGAFKHNINSLINPENSGNIEEESRCILHLRKHISDEEGWVIGRILNAKEAFKGANQPFDDILQNSINNRWIHVASNFPFTGFTNLTARTKPICSIKKDGWRTLVLGLEHCTAPFPFENATFPRDNDNHREANSNNKLSPEDKKPAWLAPKNKESDGSKDLQNKREPNKECSTETITLPTNRFAAIEGKKPDKPIKEQCHYMTGISTVASDKESDSLSTGQGNDNDSSVGRGNIIHQRVRSKSLPASFDSFKIAIELLNKKDGVSAYVRPLNELIKYLPLTKSARYRQWAYLDSKTYCRRQVITANIEYQKRQYILLEFESRKGESFNVALISVATGYQISDIGLNKLLGKLAYEKGVWAKIAHLFSNIEVVTMKHTWSSNNQFSDSVLKKVINQF